MSNEYARKLEAAKKLLASHEEYAKRISAAGLGCLDCPREGEPAMKMSWGERCMEAYRIKRECALLTPLEQKYVPALLVLSKMLPKEVMNDLWKQIHRACCLQPAMGDLCMDDFIRRGEQF